MNNQEELNKLVGVHLGKAGDGTAVKPYITPDAVDKSLLVAIPRYLNRTSYDLKEDKLPFFREFHKSGSKFIGCNLAFNFNRIFFNRQIRTARNQIETIVAFGI